MAVPAILLADKLRRNVYSSLSDRRNVPEFQWHTSSFAHSVHAKPEDPPKLLDQVRQACRLRHYSPRTEDAYCRWIRRFIIFHSKQHPRTLGPAAVTTFLSSLATKDDVSASTQNQALCALLFLYRMVLHQPLPDATDGLIRARKPTTVPTVLTRSEVRAVRQGNPTRFHLHGHVLDVSK